MGGTHSVYHRQCPRQRVRRPGRARHVNGQRVRTRPGRATRWHAPCSRQVASATCRCTRARTETWSRGSSPRGRTVRRMAVRRMFSTSVNGAPARGRVVGRFSEHRRSQRRCSRSALRLRHQSQCGLHRMQSMFVSSHMDRWRARLVSHQGQLQGRIDPAASELGAQHCTRWEPQRGLGRHHAVVRAEHISLHRGDGEVPRWDQFGSFGDAHEAATQTRAVQPLLTQDRTQERGRLFI